MRMLNELDPLSPTAEDGDGEFAYWPDVASMRAAADAPRRPAGPDYMSLALGLARGLDAQRRVS